MQTYIERVKAAVAHLKQGKIVVLTDHPERENEGDLIIPAETITAEHMNFIIRNSSGIVCISLSPELIQKFNLPFMVPPTENSSLRQTPFTISVDAKHGITTGVSAADRVKTAKVFVDENVSENELVKPGHIFPLAAQPGGVLQRQGHTEGAVDLVRIAGFKPAAVLCELMNSDGTMMRGKALEKFAKANDMVMLSIDDIVAYRLQHESLIAGQASATIPLDTYGEFNITIIKEKFTNNEHVVLFKERTDLAKIPLVRIHSACLTGDLLASERCDCHQQLHYALSHISQEGGMLIYLNQEGRGIGLFNKIKAYALQEQGYDTVEANEKLGLPVDARNYYLAANILRHYHIDSIRLLTNNPNKIVDLHKYGIKQIEREPMPTFMLKHNQFYLQTKKEKLKHVINLPEN